MSFLGCKDFFGDGRYPAPPRVCTWHRGDQLASFLSGTYMMSSCLRYKRVLLCHGRRNSRLPLILQPANDWAPGVGGGFPPFDLFPLHHQARPPKTPLSRPRKPVPLSLATRSFKRISLFMSGSMTLCIFISSRSATPHAKPIAPFPLSCSVFWVQRAAREKDPFPCQ